MINPAQVPIVAVLGVYLFVQSLWTLEQVAGIA